MIPKGRNDEVLFMSMQYLTKKLLTLSLMLAPLASLAQLSRPKLPGDLPQATKVQTVEGVNQVISDVVGWITGLFFVAAILFLFYAAYLYLSAGGDEEQLKKAKTQLIYSIVAIAIALLATSIQRILGSLLGVSNLPQ